MLWFDFKCSNTYHFVESPNPVLFIITVLTHNSLLVAEFFLSSRQLRNFLRFMDPKFNCCANVCVFGGNVV